jgi:hypothetical protein
MPPFTKARGGRIALRVGQREADALRQLLGNLEMSLATGQTDGEMERLFPPGYTDDAEAQREFAHFTTDDLRDGKRTAILRCIESLDGARRKGDDLIAELDDERQQAWLGALNDLRLSLGTRLGVTEEAYEREAIENDLGMQVYLYLGYLEENLVDVLLTR